VKTTNYKDRHPVVSIPLLLPLSDAQTFSLRPGYDTGKSLPIPAFQHSPGINDGETRRRSQGDPVSRPRFEHK